MSWDVSSKTGKTGKIGRKNTGKNGKTGKAVEPHAHQKGNILLLTVPLLVGFKRKPKGNPPTPIFGGSPQKNSHSETRDGSVEEGMLHFGGILSRQNRSHKGSKLYVRLGRVCLGSRSQAGKMVCDLSSTARTQLMKPACLRIAK